MSLMDLGKNDISEETQALKDKLASRDTECAGLRTRLMRREAELEELQATFNDNVYKLSKEAERALQLEEQVSTRSSELKTERISLRNTELALQSAQEKLNAEERAKRELESTLDTVSLHSQTASAEHQSVQREKRALESRVRELERLVQTYESRRVSNIPQRSGRPRSSSVSNLRLPAVEQELNDAKAQLHTKDTSMRMLEQKLAQAQDDLVKAENARISVDKAGQKRILELLSTLESKEEELGSLRETDHAGEREEELLKRIDEDAAKIAALEKLATESQATRASQARIQKLQNQLKAECGKVHRSEDLQSQLLHEKEELARQCEASRREIYEGHQLLMARDCQIKELEARQASLLADLDAYSHRKELLSPDAQRSSPQRPNAAPAFPNESALADHIQTLLLAIDRLRDERDGLRRALEFSEVEYRITTEGFQARVASLTRQITEDAHAIVMDKPPINTCVEQRMKRLTSCAAAFSVVISNLQTQLDLSEDRLSAITANLTSSNSQLYDALAVINDQKQTLTTNAHEHDDLRHKLDATAKKLSESNEVRESAEAACILLKETLQRLELSLAESEKAGKTAEFSLTLQTTQHEKVVTALRREIASLQSGPELHSILADLEEKNREMDDLLRAKCQEIEEYDDRILETLKANKKLTSKVESLTRKVQALQAKLSSMKKHPREPVAEVTPLKKASSIPSPPIPAPITTHVGSYPSSFHDRESSVPSLNLRSKTPEPRTESRPQPVVALPSSHTPGTTSEFYGTETSVGKKRPAPDDDERDGVPAEGYYSTDPCLRNGPTPRLRRAHGHPAGFTPMRGASSRKPGGLSSPGRRVNVGVMPSEVITDVTNSPRGFLRQGDPQLKKSWLGKIRGGAGSQPASFRLGTLGQ